MHVLYKTTHGQHHIETMGRLMWMDPHPNRPQGNPWPYPFPRNIFSKGAYRSPLQQAKYHSQAQYESIHPLLGENIRSSGVPFTQLSAVVAINFFLGQHFVTYKKEDPPPPRMIPNPILLHPTLHGLSHPWIFPKRPTHLQY